MGEIGTNGGAEVFWADLSGDPTSDLLGKLEQMLRRSGIPDAALPKRLVCCKVHFGEKGNTAFTRPLYVARIVRYFAERGAKPFLADTNTLYVGSRGDAVTHHRTAEEHGFGFPGTGAPVIIAGGLKGTRGSKVPVNGRHFSQVEIADEFLDADILVGITHFKGHEMSGFGGTLKNFGMGTATRAGKLAMHSKVNPQVRPESCTGCRLCARWCAHGAIAYPEGKARIEPARCVGCGACLATCPEEAIRIVWNGGASDMQEKMVEHACGCLQERLDGRAFFFNFVIQVSPLCDCYPFTGSPLVPDLGVLASRDPVALDQASVDLVNKAVGLPGSVLPGGARAGGEDKFRGVHPHIDWEVQLRHAERLGLGSRSYLLVPV
jgi:hypothetical protein